MSYLTKLITVLIAVAIAISFAACSNRTISSKAETSKPESGSFSASSQPAQQSSGGAQEPEATPAQGIELTVELAQEIMDRGRVSSKRRWSYRAPAPLYLC